MTNPHEHKDSAALIAHIREVLRLRDLGAIYNSEAAFEISLAVNRTNWDNVMAEKRQVERTK